MNYLKIIDAKSYIPKNKILNEEIEKELNLKRNYIEKRTGIKERYYARGEKIEEIALEAVKKIEKSNKIKDIDLIITATTSSKNIMPGISNYIQKKLDIKPCIALDILAGCSGFINAFDIVETYIKTGKIEKALIIGVDVLSEIIDKQDIGTRVVLSDGAGALLVEKTEEQRKYHVNIKAESDEKSILTYKVDSSIYMDGKEVYKYAVTKTIENVEELLKKSGEKLENVKYIIPHQSNFKIMKAIANRLKIDEDKIYINIYKKGNTFCASIPIAIAEMKEEGLLKDKDKIILLGYGGGLNTGSILLEI